MCDKEPIVGYLYDELTAPERRAFESHLGACTDCRSEVEALRGTRMHLTAWAPPEPELGFQILRGSTSRPAPRRWFSPSPAWGLAAAAVLVLAVASAIANVEVRVGGGQGFVVRTGWSGAPAGPAGSPPPLADAAAPSAVAPASPAGVTYVQNLERRVVELESAVKASGTAGPSLTQADVTRLVKTLLTESERRQQQELAYRIAQVNRDVDQARMADLARIQQAFLQVQGIADVTQVRQREMENRFFRGVAQQR